MVTRGDELRQGGTSGGLLRRCAILTLALGICFAGLAPLSYRLSGVTGVAAVAAALAVCLTSGLLALLLTESFRKPEFVLPYVLVATGIRTGLPLILVLVIYLRPGPMTEAGFVYYLLAFYLVTLLVETGLTVQSQKVGANGPAKAS